MMAAWKNKLYYCCIFLQLLSSAINPSWGEKVLDRVLIVSRHGVRSQFLRPGTCSADIYAPGKWFATPEEWGAQKDGYLTDHGYKAVQLMGGYQGQRYKAALFKEHASDESDAAAKSICQGSFVYTDDMQRDLKTAEAFFAGIVAPGGTCQVATMVEDMDAIMDQGAKTLRPGCDLMDEAQVRGRIGDNLKEIPRLFRSRFEKLSETLGCCDPEVCEGNSPCSLADAPFEWEPAWFNTFKGPLYCAKYYSEWFLLTYLNGMDNLNWGWGSLTPEDVMDLSIFVTENRDLEFDLIAAKAHGSTLLSHILLSLHQWVDRKPSTHDILAGLHHPPTTRLLYYGAHDTNLLYLRELLGLKWLSTGWQKGHTPPGGQITFELWTDTSVQGPGRHEVRLFFDVMSPQQIRSLDALDPQENPASRAPLTVPGCSKGEHLGCSWEDFLAVARSAIRRDCVVGEPLEKYLDSLSHVSHQSEQCAFPMVTFWLANGISLLCGAILLIGCVYMARRQGRLYSLLPTSGGSSGGS